MHLDADRDNAINIDNHAAVALALELDEDALQAVELAAVKPDACAFCEVYLVGAQVYQLFVVGDGQRDESLHIVVGNDDGDVTPVLGARDVLHVADALLQLAHLALAGVRSRMTGTHLRILRPPPRVTT